MLLLQAFLAEASIFGPSRTSLARYYVLQGATVLAQSRQGGVVARLVRSATTTVIASGYHSAAPLSPAMCTSYFMII